MVSSTSYFHQGRDSVLTLFSPVRYLSRSFSTAGSLSHPSRLNSFTRNNISRRVLSRKRKVSRKLSTDTTSIKTNVESLLTRYPTFYKDPLQLSIIHIPTPTCVRVYLHMPTGSSLRRFVVSSFRRFVVSFGFVSSFCFNLLFRIHPASNNQGDDASRASFLSQASTRPPRYSTRTYYSLLRVA